MATAALGATVTTNFRIVGGVAKPQDLATLGIFQGLQRALNNTLARFRAGGAPNVPANLTTDGDLGTRTLTAAQFSAQVLGVRAPELSAFSSSVNNLAINAATFTDRLGQLGGFTPAKTADPARAATAVTAETKPAVTPSQALVPASALPEPLGPPEAPEKKNGIHWGWWLAGGLLLAAGGYAIFRVARKPKKALSGDDFEYDDDVEFDYAPADDIIDV